MNPERISGQTTKGKLGGSFTEFFVGILKKTLGKFLKQFLRRIPKWTFGQILEGNVGGILKEISKLLFGKFLKESLEKF